MRSEGFHAYRSTVDVCREILLHGLENEEVKSESVNWLGHSKKS